MARMTASAGVESRQIQRVAAKAGPPARKPGRRYPTPAILRLPVAAVVAAAVFSGLASATGASQVRSGLDAVGHREAPQVVAAGDLAYALNDMDANLANVLMVGGARLGPGIDRASFTTLFQDDRTEADSDLEQAAARAGTDGAAARQVNAALDALGTYEALAAQLMFADAAHPARPAGQTPADEVALFDQATDLMRTRVLPAAQAVVDGNTAALEASYRDRHAAAGRAVLLVVLAGVLLLAALAALQLVLTRRTRRVLNPALLAATALSLAVAVHGASALGGAASELRSAKKDAFDSVSALTAAKALGTDANADESRLVVDPARAAQYQASFEAKSQRLLDVGTDATLQTYDASLKTALDSYFGDPNHLVAFGGYLGAEMRNITFPGERDAAEATLKAYQAYELDDRVFRGKLADDVPEAVRFDTSPAAADSDGAFTAYTAALKRVTDVNQAAFTERIGAGLAELSGWPWLPLGLLAGAVALTLAGLRPRLAEYR